MANKREIKNRLRGIRKTQQITRAMKMVAAVKLRHAQAALLNGRPYAERMRSLAADLLVRMDPPPSEHPFFSRRPAKNTLLVVVASDRGLCGSMNTNIFRQVMRALAGPGSPGPGQGKPEVHLFLVGRKAKDFFRARQNITGNPPYQIRETVNFAEVNAGLVGAQCAELYRKGEFDRIELFYNGTSSGLHHHPVRATFLPLDLDNMRKEAGPLAGSVIFEPAGAEMLDDVIYGYIASEMRRIMMEAEVAEHAARMLMMDLATRNADDLISAMQLTMNKLRQLSITSELADITTGAEAVG